MYHAGKLIVFNLESCDRVSAVLYHRVEDPIKAVFNVQDVGWALTNLALSDLRDALCSRTFSEILEKRQTIAEHMQNSMTDIAQHWGVTIEKLTLKNIDLVDPAMVRVLAKEAEATRERTAQIIRADGMQQNDNCHSR